MEFLMTYGWAILVVLAAIGALAYFGILSPDRFLPSSYTMTGGISAAEYKMGTSSLQFAFINNVGTTINVESVTVNTTGGSGVNCNTNNTVTTGFALDNGQKSALLTVCNPTGAAYPLGDRFKANVHVVYNKSGEALSHTATGSITAKVEP